jgi:hypothetical protein
LSPPVEELEPDFEPDPECKPEEEPLATEGALYSVAMRECHKASPPDFALSKGKGIDAEESLVTKGEF